MIDQDAFVGIDHGATPSEYDPDLSAAGFRHIGSRNPARGPATPYRGFENTPGVRFRGMNRINLSIRPDNS